jgi:hypothetical protein
LQKTCAGATYILAVNLAEAAVEVRFDGLPEDVAEANVLFERRTRSITNQMFRDEFLPAAVHVYEVKHR